MAGGLLEAVVGAHEVRVDQEAGRPVRAGHDRRLRGALDEGVEAAGGPQVVGLAHVAVDELDAGLAQARDVELVVAAVQAVEGDELPALWVAGEELEGGLAPMKPAPPVTRTR